MPLVRPILSVSFTGRPRLVKPWNSVIVNLLLLTYVVGGLVTGTGSVWQVVLG